RRRAVGGAPFGDARFEMKTLDEDARVVDEDGPTAGRRALKGRGGDGADGDRADHLLSIVRSAIAKRRNPIAPRQYPTGSSRKVVCMKAFAVPTQKASAARPINAQQTVRMAAIIR